MPAIFHVKIEDESFDGAVNHIVEASDDDTVWHCEEAGDNFDGAIFHVKWAEDGHEEPVWRVSGISRGTVTTVGPAVSPLLLPSAIADSLTYVKAFGGTEQRDIPDDYLQRQFIYMMDGSYLLTDIVPTYDCKVEMDFATTSLNSQGYVFLGGRSASDAGSGIQFYCNSTNTFIADGFGTRYTSSVTAVANTRYKYTYNNQIATLESGSSTLFTTTYTTSGANTAALALNAMNNNGSIQGNTVGIYLYSFKVWNAQGELVANYVPAVQKGTVPVVGFYDTVSKTFKTATAGTFAAGGEAVPTPDAPMDIVSNNGVLKARHQSGLPLGYTAVEYLQNGSGNCAINTGIAPTNTTRIEMKWSVSDTSSIYIFGSRPGGSTQVFTLSGSQSGGTVTAYANGYYKAANTDGVNWNRTSGIDNIFNSYFALNNGEAEYAVDDLVNDRHCDEFFTYTPWVSDIDTPLHLFSNGYNAQPGGAKIWYCKIYNGETLLMDLVPVIRNSDNVGGFYDKVGGGFYTTEQGGTYTGTPITDPVEIYTDGTVETIKDSLNNTATAEMLLKVGDYTDVQEILSGEVTRKVSIKVLDGTEGWVQSAATNNLFYATISNSSTDNTYVPISSHFQGVVASTGYAIMTDGQFKHGSNTNSWYFKNTGCASAAEFSQFLANQYNAGTPVIVVYPLTTPTTESVAGQTLQVTQGDNVLEITQASLDGLELEAKYMKGVVASAQEVEPQGLDNNVSVSLS